MLASVFPNKYILKSKVNRYLLEKRATSAITSTLSIAIVVKNYLKKNATINGLEQSPSIKLHVTLKMSSAHREAYPTLRRTVRSHHLRTQVPMVVGSASYIACFLPVQLAN